jgi:hypothetical protein
MLKKESWIDFELIKKEINAPKNMSTEEGGRWFYDAYQKSGGILKKTAKVVYAEQKESCRNSDEEYDLAVSISQLCRTLTGRLAETIVEEGLHSIFGHILLATSFQKELQRYAQKSSKKSFDAISEFHRALIYFSVTTIPQERKDRVWSQEAQICHDFHKRDKIVSAREIMFVGFAFSAGKNTTIEAAQSLRRRKQAELGKMGVVVVAQDITATTTWLRELLAKVH